MYRQPAALFSIAGGTSTYESAAEITCRMRPAEPVYLFSESNLMHRAARFIHGFPGVVSYAVKANPEIRVIDALVARGIDHFDVASPGEVEALARRHRGLTLHFNNPIKAIDAIEKSFRDYGVRSFAVDEQAELDKVRKATAGSRDILYSVRFKLKHEGASYDFGSKFGATPEEAIALLRRIDELGARPALTFHPGSQCAEPQVYARYLRAAARIIALSGVEVEQVNVGGGFPEQYENTQAPALEDYFGVIERAAQSLLGKRVRLMCEPGRAMVASSVSLLTRVIHIRDDGATVFLNDGVYGGMLEQSLVDLRLPVRVWREGRHLLGPTASCRVFGPTCDPVDRLPHALDLPVGVRAGDYLEFGLLGAYGSATATAFNGFRPALYLNVVEGFGAS